MIKYDSHEQQVCATTGDYLIPIKLEQVTIKDTDFIVSGGDKLKIPNTNHYFNQVFAEGLWFLFLKSLRSFSCRRQQIK